MLNVILIILHVLVSVVLILVVLLQTGKRADLAGAFGGGGSQTAFGARGAATLLSKATTACAVIFMITSLALSIVTSQRVGEGTVLDDLEPASTSPATPVESPPPSEQPAPSGLPVQEIPDPTTGAETEGDEAPAE